MSQPFLAELKIISWNYPPKGWAFASGQLLPINQNQALFSLLGTTYGGDGRVNFALPDLRGRVPMHMGSSGFGSHTLGERGGETAHTVTISEMPQHTHLVSANSNTATVGAATNNYWSATGSYASNVNGAMLPTAITNTGGSQPHNNVQPYLVINIIIALQGIFPSQT